MSYHLSSEQIENLRNTYHELRDSRSKDRVRVVLALTEGFSPSDLSKIFLLDADTIRRYFRLF
ncbi:MAG: hypothetical protein LBP87_06940, partial [Planctomycetaceae bacterium]|nr:hypothetical protein [Planctomycetaceae bacterium]